MDVMKRRGLIRRLTGSVLIGLLAATLADLGAAPAARADAEERESDAVVAQGDALVTNYSFEAGLDGWSATDGQGGKDEACNAALSVSEDWSSHGGAALLIDPERGCHQAGAISEITPIEPEQTYTAWADVGIEQIARLGLQWVDDDGEVVGTEHTRREVRSDRDRKSTRLNSSHVAITYAVFCMVKTYYI